jgi:hypothetical protein
MSGHVGGHEDTVPALVFFRSHFLEYDSSQAAGGMREHLGCEEIHDRDAFADRVFLFPRRGLRLIEAGAHDDLDVGAAATRLSTAVHGRVAAAEHDDAPADRRDIAKRNVRKSVDADVDVARCFAAPRNIEVAPSRRSAADEDRVVAFVDQTSETVDATLSDELAAIEKA